MSTEMSNYETTNLDEQYDFGPLPVDMPTGADVGGDPGDSSPDPVYLALWKIDQLRSAEGLGASECLELIADVLREAEA